MKKKIIGIIICMLLIATSLQAVGTTNDNITSREVSSDYNNLMQQIIDVGYISNGWSEEDKLLASDGAKDDWFGCSVSIDGDYAIIGAWYDDDNGEDSGSAYVFKRSGTTWTEEAKLTASDGTANDRFGISVSIDGDTALIGALWDDDNGENSGSAYIFKRSGSSWTEEDKLLASDGAEDDWFGYFVSIDGDYAIIGAPYDDDNGEESGSAYVFKRSGSSWTEEDKLLASDGAYAASFGISVSIDVDYAIIGAIDNDNGENSGSAYIFKRSGTSWIEEDKLLASDGEARDYFGRWVSISGYYAIIGAFYDDDNGDKSGSAYIFKRSGTSWIEEDKLLASDGAEDDWFGGSVSIDGDYAIIGAPGDDDNGEFSGSAYVFKRSGSSWTEEDKLLASDGAFADSFGYSVSIDGDYAIVGACRDDDNGENSGSAYVFRKVDPNAPNAPTITGDTSGKAGIEYEYTFNAEDPNGDNVKYHIDWDDGDSDTTDFNPSGTDVKVKHTWSDEGTYIIKATAEDEFGLVGPEATLTVTMPRNRAINFNLNLLQGFLEQFPILQKILLLRPLGIQN